jgi:hypothetical protein
VTPSSNAARGTQTVRLTVEQCRLHLCSNAEQSLLGAVVQVALDPTTLIDLGPGDALARRPDLFQLHCDGSSQAGVVEFRGRLIEHCPQHGAVVA